ncbi:tRNA-dependent cyclodipeptide synthase [Streptomyces uncialis]|uniref:tRNA-dependent cyclodipeptide synthase n=1 Tax=Streptomyces uncialis TaxID=1048205 RepID=UPI002E34A5FF|nr:tRNA-dependent cyclodipeptide synthase [Streptomyces uncialis]
MTKFEVEPVTPTCRRIYERGDHALIGVSAGNSYFHQERLGSLLAWAEEHFTLVDVLYIDTHIDAMLIATGLTPAQAGSRTRSMLKDVRRRIRRALEKTSGTAHGRLRVRSMSECAQLPAYQAVLRRLDRDFDDSGPVRRAAEEQVRELLEHHSGPVTEHSADSVQIQAGLAYVRSEIPFLLDTPAILGVPSSVTCYHKLMPVVTALYQEPGSPGRSPRQGFLVVSPEPVAAPDSPPQQTRSRTRREQLTLTEQYDEIAADYTDVERVFSTYRSLIEIPSLLRALGPVEGASVLDLGCGSGAYARLLRRRGAAEVLGVDVSPGMIEVARALEEREPVGVRYEVVDAADMPVLGTFDAVVAVAVLHYADSRATLARMMRQTWANLAPGGRFLAYVGNPRLPADSAQMNGLVVHRPDNARDGDPSPLTIPTTPPTTLPARYWSCETIEKTLRASGFTDVVWEPLDGLPSGAQEPVNLLVSARAQPVGAAEAVAPSAHERAPLAATAAQ